MPYASPAQRAAVWAKRNAQAVLTSGNPVTKQEVHDYYSNPVIKQRVLAALANRDLLAIQSRSPDEQIVRRYRKKNEPIRVENPEDLDWYSSRRYTEFHPTVGEKTDEVWVDIDPGKNKNTEDTKGPTKFVYDLLRTIPAVKAVELAFSGGRGFHVRGKLDKPRPTNEARGMLQEYLKQLPERHTELTLKTPRPDEIRLDVSTLHPKGSIRAPYSLNAETGLVAVPLVPSQLEKFNPQKDATPQTVLGKTEFAPGIPQERKTYPLPDFKRPKTWTLAIQEHDAQRAGKHWDLRLVDPRTTHAHSWAVPKAQFPQGNSPLLAVQTPTHTARYALTFGERKPKEIRKGYGKGVVQILHKEPVKVLSSSPDKIKFERDVDGNPERYMLFKSKENSWLMRRIKEAGRAAMLKKLGVDKSKFVGKKPSNTELETPMDVEDEGLPAGQLARALSDIPTAAGRENRDAQGTDDVEGRLNRTTTWTEPDHIPIDYAQGPSPVMPGKF